MFGSNASNLFRLILAVYMLHHMFHTCLLLIKLNFTTRQTFNFATKLLLELSFRSNNWGRFVTRILIHWVHLIFPVWLNFGCHRFRLRFNAMWVFPIIESCIFPAWLQASCKSFTSCSRSGGSCHFGNLYFFSCVSLSAIGLLLDMGLF